MATQRKRSWLAERTAKMLSLLKSRRRDVSSVETVCVGLGPLRNLTTLTASVLFLHPRCQVLNHAGKRVLGDPRINFLSDGSDKTLERFTAFAIEISESGTKGTHGGSITHSHAFGDGHVMRDVFESTGQGLVKDEIRCLFWKEPIVVANHLRAGEIPIDRLLESLPRLRFLLPVRNPLDCAESNVRKGTSRLLISGFDGADTAQTLDALLDEYLWFLDLEARHPGRFMHYFEHRFDAALLGRLAEFLCLDADPEWIANALRVFDIKPKDPHPDELQAHLRRGVAEKFTSHPEFGEALLAFLDPAPPPHA